MFTRIHNVVIAVNNVEEATKLYTTNFDLKPKESNVAMPKMGIKRSLFTVGDGNVELIEPLEAGQGPVAKFLQARGEGLYMMELEVKSVDAAVQAFQKKGVRLLGADPESRAKGGSVFIHPQSAKGVLIQLVEKKH